MEYLKEYTQFTESKKGDYSIYDWFEYLKAIQWNSKRIDELELNYWTEHFIGDGWFNKIKNKFLEIEKSLEKVNPENVYDRMYTIWDELPQDKEKYVYLGVSYGNLTAYDKADDVKYSGILTYKKNNILSLMIHFIKDVVYHTSFIGYPSVILRKTNEQEYVQDKKWNCANFNIDNYEIKSGDKIDSLSINDKKKFDINKALELYQPSLIIDIGGFGSRAYHTGEFDINKLEDMLDDNLDMILSEVDYKNIIWDHVRYKRKFENSMFREYTLKIILN